MTILASDIRTCDYQPEWPLRPLTLCSRSIQYAAMVNTPTPPNPENPTQRPPSALTAISTRRSFMHAATMALMSMAVPVSVAAEGATSKRDGPAEGTEAYETLSESARKFFAEKLKKNRESAEAFHEMLPTIREFETFAGVKVEVCKCMDGRLHGNAHKGLPPTFASNRRSQGNVIDVGRGNKDFWDSMEDDYLEARSKGVPLLIIGSAHRADIGSGCAAHKRDWDTKPSDGDKRALDVVREEALQLRKAFEGRKDVQVLSAMTNTDTGAMTFYNGEELFNAETTMAAAKLRDARDVFEGEFMAAKITEDWAHPLLKNKTPHELLLGKHAPFFTDTRTQIALEAYLMRRIATSKPRIGENILRPDILDAAQGKLEKMPPKIKTFLTYMFAMNLAHASHRRNENAELAKTDKPALMARVEHGEKVLGYGMGFDLDTPNSVILVKPGGGNDEQSVAIGHKVISHNLEAMRLADTLPPLVQINLELSGPIDNWTEYRRVMARLRTKVGIVNKEFGTHVRILTTYSYHQGAAGSPGVSRTKQYFPINPDPENRTIVVTADQDIGSRMPNERSFSAKELHAREQRYTESGHSAPAEERKGTAKPPMEKKE